MGDKKKNMQEKNIIVTGGASGIGLAIVKRFALAGARVHVWDFNKEQGKKLEQDMQAQGCLVQFSEADVSKQKDIKLLVDQIEGTLDVLINNAGISHVGALHHTAEEDFDRLYEVNVKGLYNCAYAVIPRMLEQQSGVIINMASVASVVGIPDRFAYSMTKGAALTMTLSIARDYVKQGIRCNAISPARIHTPFVDGFLAKNYPGREQEMFDTLAATQPIGRMGTPDEVASMVMFLCSDDAKFITGGNFPVDGGFVSLKI